MANKICITGSSGLVGSEAVNFFKEKGWEVFGIDNNMRSYFFGTPKQKTQHNLDIRNEFQMEKIFKENKFDAIIHAAGQPSHDWAKNDPLMDFDVNARATLILLEMTRKHCPEAVFVHVSTDKVYGQNMDLRMYENPWIEKDTRYEPSFEVIKSGFHEKLGLDFAGQRSLFGCSKTAADIYVQEYGNYFNMKTACFRCGCITGKQHQGAEAHGFLAYLVKCIKEGKTYKIFGYQGKQVRDQIHAYDLVNAFYHFIQKPSQGAVFNMGGGAERSVSVLEAGEMISKELGKPFLHEFHGARQGDRVFDIHDVSKFRSQFPEWDYKFSLRGIIKELCEV